MTLERQIDYRMVRQCAPTLAARKVGSLFCIDTGDSQNPVCTVLARWNRDLNPSGVVARVIAERCCRTFVYVYREEALQGLFAQADVRHFLRNYGYSRFDTMHALEYMTQRIERCHCFPHEVGLFLGYPLEDVKGFIENGGKNSKYTGYWKVYGDVCASKKCFECYRKCVMVMSTLFEKGYSLPMLAVAC